MFSRAAAEPASVDDTEVEPAADLVTLAELAAEGFGWSRLTGG